MDLQFHWDEVEASERQPDGSLFSWFERYCCYRHIIYGIVNTSTSTVVLKSDGNEVHWEPGKPLSCYSPLLFVSMFSTMHIFYLLNSQYIMSTIYSFLFRVSWDVHKMDALPSCIWTYGAVSGFWVIAVMNYPAGVDDESKFLEVNGISFSPLWYS